MILLLNLRRLFQKNEVVERLVVVVIKIHYASHKWMLQMSRVYLLFTVFIKILGNHDRLFYEVRGVYYSVGVKFAEFFQVSQSF